MRNLRDERGNVLLLAAFSMSMLLSFLAMAVDVGNLFFTQRQLQTLADAAAMAGAQVANACSANCSGAITTAAQSALTEGSPSVSSRLFTNCANATGTGVLLTVNNGPCALAGDPNSGQSTYVEAVVSETVPTFFAKIFGVKTLNITARAEAGKPAPSNDSPIWATDVKLNGGKVGDAPGSYGGIYADSDAFCDSGGDSAAYKLNSSGSTSGNGYNNGVCGTVPTKVTAVPEPFSKLVEPAKPAASPTNATTYENNPSNPVILQPGAYTSLAFDGSNYTVQFAPGLYYFTGAVTGGTNVTFSGDGVTFFFAGNGSFTTNSNLNMNMTPPSAFQIAQDTTHALYNGCTSCADMSIWQSASDTILMKLDAGANMTMKGSIYVPSAEIRMDGPGTITTIADIVCDYLDLESGSNITISSGGASNGPKTVALVE